MPNPAQAWLQREAGSIRARMKLLTNDRAELIEALVAESSLGGITTSLLEKDEHLTDALRAIFALKFEYVDLVFCGGTSLSKAHSLIERMSEDADLKVVLTEAGKLLRAANTTAI